MPEKDTMIKVKNIDDELYLLMERDFPMLQKDVEEIKKTLKVIEKSNENDRSAIREISSQIVRVTEDVRLATADVKSVSEDLKSFATAKQEEKPWWLDFRNILILLLVLGVMTLAGVKAYDGLISKISPSLLISTPSPDLVEENI